MGSTFGSARTKLSGFEIICSFCLATIGLATKGKTMGIENENADLDRLQSAYKAAAEQWRAAIGEEEALASVNHSVAEVDRWEAAHFREDELRNKAKAAKKEYEAALRLKFFGFR